MTYTLDYTFFSFTSQETEYNNLTIIKKSIENNHIQLRYILPKQTDLASLGLTDQDALNIVLSHINSAPVEKFGGRSPLEVASFMYPNLYEKLMAYGIEEIEKDRIVLKPYLLKNR